MILRPKIGFTYECRECGRTVKGTQELFALGREAYVCRCLCGGGVMTARLESGILKVEYACRHCGGRHCDNIALSELLRRGSWEFFCSSRGLPALRCCYPDSEKGDDARDLIEKLARLAPEEFAELARERTEEGGIITAALDAVRTLAYTGNISCHCGSKNFTMAYELDTVRVSCAKCGASVRFSAKNQSDIAKILTSDGIKL